MVDATENSFTIQGLKPHTTYHVRVKGENEVGSGDFSEPVSVVTEGEGMII